MQAQGTLKRGHGDVLSPGLREAAHAIRSKGLVAPAALRCFAQAAEDYIDSGGLFLIDPALHPATREAFGHGHYQPDFVRTVHISGKAARSTGQSAYRGVCVIVAATQEMFDTLVACATNDPAHAEYINALSPTERMLLGGLMSGLDPSGETGRHAWLLREVALALMPAGQTQTREVARRVEARFGERWNFDIAGVCTDGHFPRSAEHMLRQGKLTREAKRRLAQFKATPKLLMLISGELAKTVK